MFLSMPITGLDKHHKLQSGGQHAFNRFNDTGGVRRCGVGFGRTCPNAGAGNPAGAAVRGRNARRHAVRYSLWRVDRTERAKQVMAAAEAEAKRRNWKMNIAVVDTNGELVHFSRMEGAQIASVPISQGKARTAA